MAKTVAAAEFQAHSLELLGEVAETQEELVVTENGKPLAKVVPPMWNLERHEAQPPRRHRTLEELRGSVKTLGDIVSPLDDEWDVMK